MANTTALQPNALPGGINPPIADALPKPQLKMQLETVRKITLKLKARRA